MKDIILDSNGRLKIENGLMVVDESTMQHQAIILKISKGAIRHFPALGVGVSSVLLDESPDDLLISITKEFERDGMTMKTLDLDGSKLKIDATYENV